MQNNRAQWLTPVIPALWEAQGPRASWTGSSHGDGRCMRGKVEIREVSYRQLSDLISRLVCPIPLIKGQPWPCVLTHGHAQEICSPDRSRSTWEGHEANAQERESSTPQLWEGHPLSAEHGKAMAQCQARGRDFILFQTPTMNPPRCKPSTVNQLCLRKLCRQVLLKMSPADLCCSANSWLDVHEEE
ncbi:uncharacterized protein LOC144334623 [Macaca mulatta]